MTAVSAALLIVIVTVLAIVLAFAWAMTPRRDSWDGMIPEHERIARRGGTR